MKQERSLTTLKRQRFSTLFFAAVFTSSVGPQALERQIQVNADTEPLSVKEVSVCKLLRELDPHKSMGPDVIHPRVLRLMSL